MKTVLLISNRVLHYREKVYNYFEAAFRREGYQFRCLANEYQQVGHELSFPHDELPFSIPAYLRRIDELKPDFVILFLHLKDRVMLPIILHCRRRHIPVIYWNMGINTDTPDARLKNAVFHWIHSLCDACITYTPEMKKYFLPETQRKLFIAYNTLNLSDIDKAATPSREETRKKYGITQDKVILYISRMLPYKRVDLLMDCFRDVENVAVVIVGPGFTPEQQAVCDAHSNLYYLGERYGEEVNAIYKMGDIFSTPGHIGLAAVEAMFWGLPIVLLKGKHAPEAYYIKDGVTGYFAKDEADYKAYVLALLADEKRLREMSDAALRVFAEEVSIDRMFQGFLDAVRYCEAKKK